MAKRSGIGKGLAGIEVKLSETVSFPELESVAEQGRRQANPGAGKFTGLDSAD
jgi:hypothetical protein